MDVNIYEVIKGPWMTSKAFTLNQETKQLVLEVHPQANKPMVSEALKRLFNVEVKAIRVSVTKGKRRRAGRHVVFGKTRKKAIVTLKAGQSINLTELNPASVKKSES